MTLKDPNSEGQGIEDEQFMRAAFEEALVSQAAGEVPVGAVVVLNGEIIGRGHNRVVSDHDPSAHAEIIALRQAGRTLQNYRMPSASLYVTIEPCSMCASAISFARIKTVYFGAFDPKGGAIENGIKLYHSKSCNYKPDFYGGFKEKESSEILKSYFKTKRL